MVDTRNVIHKDYHLVNTPTKIFKIKNPNLLENIDNSLLINVYLDNRNRNRRKHLKGKFHTTKDFANKKPQYNFYCGSPIIINDEYKSKSKYD